MQVNKKEAAIIQKAINEWEDKAFIDAATSEKLQQSIASTKNDYNSLTFYAFIAAISCAILAFAAIVMDEKWIERMRRFFEFSELVIGALFALLTSFFYWIAIRRKKKYPQATLSNESFNVLIALSLGVSVAYLGKSMGSEYQQYGIVIFITAIIYGIISWGLQSKLLWICMLLAIITAWGVQTYAWSDLAHTYFLGMNYPLRMTIFGLLLLLLTTLLKKSNKLSGFYNISYYCCWFFFLVSGLFLSVSGNLDYEVWAAIRQGKLFLWALGYTILLCALIVYAYKLKDELFRDMIFLFFLVNIYTRYFEYFWDKTNKGLFFAILALSFWLIGRKAEQLRKSIL